MTATSVGSPPEPAVQLLLRLPGAGSGRGRRARSRSKPYWLEADAVDLGGSLRARSQSARVTLDAEQLDDGSWRGQYDLWLPSSGVGGATKLMPLRRDALASAAHPVAAHCRRVVEAAYREPRTAVRGAREILRWLADLDLL